MLSYRKMFGEYALYLDGKVVALVCDRSTAKPKSERKAPPKTKAKLTPARRP